MRYLPAGKVSWDLLGGLLHRQLLGHPEVLVGPGPGEDAAVVDPDGRCLVAATDPITFAADAIGYYAVQVNANDVAAMGAEPRWFLATILLPEGQTTGASVADLIDQLGSACRQIDVDLIGGHTEITSGLKRPIVVGTMLGLVDRDRLVTSGGAGPGDRIILTKGVAVEGTAVIARELFSYLKDKYDSEFIERCKNLLYNPGIGVVREARTAVEVSGIHAMHDPTEGGLATGLWELADASQISLVVLRDRIFILPETDRLCREFGLDPLGLLASGALLIAAGETAADRLIGALGEKDIAADVIARVDAGRGVRWDDGSVVPRFERDELNRLFRDS